MTPQVTTQAIERMKSEMEKYNLDEAQDIVTIGDNIFATFRFYDEGTDTINWLTIKFS